VTLDGILSKTIDAYIQGTEPVTVVMSTKFKKVSSGVSLAKLAHVLQGGHHAIVIGQGNVHFYFDINTNLIFFLNSIDSQPIGVVTQLELTNFIFQ